VGDDDLLTLMGSFEQFGKVCLGLKGTDGSHGSISRLQNPLPTSLQTGWSDATWHRNSPIGDHNKVGRQ
jgi:hypothetical protein